MNIQEQTLYPSLPPQVVGKKFGEVILKFTKFVLYSPGDTTSSTKNPQTIPGFGYKVKFRFWGQQSNDIILISLPWKVGNPIEEAIFPIRVNRYYFEEYLSDMNELNFEIIDNKGKLFGYATVKMESIIHRNLIYRDGLSIYKDSGAKKIEIGKLFFEFVCHFDQNSSLENKPQLSVFQRVEVIFIFSCLCDTFLGFSFN